STASRPPARRARRPSPGSGRARRRSCRPAASAPRPGRPTSSARARSSTRGLFLPSTLPLLRTSERLEQLAVVVAGEARGPAEPVEQDRVQPELVERGDVLGLERLPLVVGQVVAARVEGLAALAAGRTARDLAGPNPVV